MEGIQRVLSRISSIEQRFNSPTASSAVFSQALATAEDRLTAQVAPQGAGMSASRADIAKAIAIAANKYDVDSKLAMAVATAESNLTQDTVSQAGAVGVMQLMPETARALGVKNIYDVRDNIDGGIRYLKQMLATFNGDVAKAVAAYNAGPEAVKNYNGIPPYAETRAYVNRVLSLYR